MTARPAVVAAAAAAACALAAAPAALAHGGARLTEVDLGPMRAQVSALLVRPASGPAAVDFTTYLNSRASGRPIDDARVRVVVRGTGGVRTLRALASRGTYQVLVPLARGESWRRLRLQIAVAERGREWRFGYAPPSLASEWSLPAPVVAGAALAAVLFAQAFWRLRRRGRRDHAPWTRAALFAAALVVGVLALVSPLDPIAEGYLLSAHMLQHVLIGDLAPALAITAVRGPLVFFLLPPWLLGPLARREGVRRLAEVLVRPRVAVAAWALVFAVWHIPQVYDYTLTHQLVHDLEHALFVAVGVLVWMQLVDPARRRRLTRGRRIFLATSLFWMGTVLTDVLIFSFRPLYPAYAAQPERLLGLSPLRDQQLAGLVMMVEQVLTLGTCLVLLVLPYLRGRARRPLGATLQGSA